MCEFIFMSIVGKLLYVLFGSFLESLCFPTGKLNGAQTRAKNG